MLFKRPGIEDQGAPPPVADDFMYDFKYNHELPTAEILGVQVPTDCDAHKEAEGIVSRLEEVMANGDAQGFADLFWEFGKLPLERPAISTTGEYFSKHMSAISPSFVRGGPCTYACVFWQSLDGYLSNNLGMYVLRWL